MKAFGLRKPWHHVAHKNNCEEREIWLTSSVNLCHLVWTSYLPSAPASKNLQESSLPPVWTSFSLSPCVHHKNVSLSKGLCVQFTATYRRFALLITMSAHKRRKCCHCWAYIGLTSHTTVGCAKLDITICQKSFFQLFFFCSVHMRSAVVENSSWTRLFQLSAA